MSEANASAIPDETHGSRNDRYGNVKEEQPERNGKV
jgi:hypothetical protein